MCACVYVRVCGGVLVCVRVCVFVCVLERAISRSMHSFLLNEICLNKHQTNHGEAFLASRSEDVFLVLCVLKRLFSLLHQIYMSFSATELVLLLCFSLVCLLSIFTSSRLDLLASKLELLYLALALIALYLDNGF